MPILNYTTKIDSYKTINEIQKMLSKNGASKITIDNNANGNPIAITFLLKWKENNVAFALPCNFEGVLKAMEKDKNISKSFLTHEQSLRVGWRIIKDWIEAQIAIIQAELATMPEIFLPYAVTKDGKTLFKYLESNTQLLLTNKN